MFSSRVPSLVPNRWSQMLSAFPPRVDLTVSNPTLVGLPYPPDLLAPLADPRGMAYHPASAGLSSAREAVAQLYRAQGLPVSPEQILLTASTSESYSLLAKLLCEPGEGFLVPQPSYPLFEHLLRAESCQTFFYPLPEETGFRLDAARISLREGVKAVVVVQPNNPTGTVVPPGEREALVALCRQRGWALVADEVFWEFPLSESPRQSFAGNPHCLTFVLGGLSKLVGLPQLKVGWMVVSGPEELAGEAFSRLEFLADTYLSVATPTQEALPEILSRGLAVRQGIGERVKANLQLLKQELAAFPFLQLLEPEGGWSAVLRFPRVVSEEDLVCELLEKSGVALYPGFFFDFPHEGFLVVSLLVPPEHLAFGLTALGRTLEGKLASCAEPGS
ncbi:hypothetical protein EG19_06775 [Thermoanaerobaculum aquaticum]|uniref:alanine transaminase n=1 Tax=Thermoanaerobaculum aquaticum TaxID=1312852 RepID=A0A062XV54_9BACT|nr:hypothetical protein EG19_06775 [Thermoanaerobaculum aquaticum]